MMRKEYERTGIKEHKNLRENKEQMLKRKIHEENIQITKERTAYNIEVAKKYDIDLMNSEKEYQKTLNLLEAYQLCYLRSGSSHSSNIEQLILGYSDYFLTVGENMSALSLRDFRNSIEKTIRISRKQQPIQVEDDREEYVQDTAILNFCIEYSDALEMQGLDLAMTGELINFLIDEETPIQNANNLANVKTKVRSLISPTNSK